MSDHLPHKTNGSFETKQLTADWSFLQHQSRGHELPGNTGGSIGIDTIGRMWNRSHPLKYVRPLGSANRFGAAKETR